MVVFLVVFVFWLFPCLSVVPAPCCSSLGCVVPPFDSVPLPFPSPVAVSFAFMVMVLVPTAISPVLEPADATIFSKLIVEILMLFLLLLLRLRLLLLHQFL